MDLGARFPVFGERAFLLFSDAFRKCLKANSLFNRLRKRKQHTSAFKTIKKSRMSFLKTYPILIHKT